MTTPALTITASVDLSGLSLPDLNINDGTAYEIVRAGPGGMRWIRDWAVAPDVHGAQEVSRRLDITTIPLAVRVKATTMSSLNVRVAALIVAFSQPHYNLTITIDGQTSTWKCFAADITGSDSSGSSGDGTWDKYSLAAHYRQVYDLQVPRQPVPVAGVF